MNDYQAIADFPVELGKTALCTLVDPYLNTKVGTVITVFSITDSSLYTGKVHDVHNRTCCVIVHGLVELLW